MDYPDRSNLSSPSTGEEEGEGDVPQDMTANQTQIKRKRGGQKGNRNARKHGFYSATLGPAEENDMWNIVTLEGVDPEIALIRVKLQSCLQRYPGNRRVIRERSRRVVEWYAENYGLDATTGSYLKTIVADLLETPLCDTLLHCRAAKNKWQTTKRIVCALTV